MRNFLAGKDVNLRVDFNVDGEPVSPDEDTVLYSLYGQDGTVISGHDEQDVTVLANATSASISLPSSVNTLGSGNDMERRIALVTFDFVGQTRSLRISYRLHPLLNTSAEPAAVRAMLGLSRSELPDEDIDIAAAFYELRGELNTDALNEALASGGTVASAADEAVVATAALAVFPSLRLRVLQSKESDGSSASRFSTVDLRALSAEISSRRADLMRAINGALQEDLVMAVKTADTDLFGGA